MNDLYKTKDLYLSTTLFTLGFALVDVGLKWNESRKHYDAEFIFNRKQAEELNLASIDILADKFYNNESFPNISPFMLLSNQKRLKGKIYEVTDGVNNKKREEE